MQPAMDSTADGHTPPASEEDSPGDAGQSEDDVLARYEEMFASRYTAEDPHYGPYIDKGIDPPPIVENYHIRRQRQPWNDNSREQRYGQDRGQKRRYGDAGSQDDRGHWNRPPHHQGGGGWGHHEGNQGRGHHQGSRGWGHPHQGDRDHRQSARPPPPPQDHGRWDGPGQGSQPGRERSYDSRDRGRPSGRPEQRSRDANPHPPQDEWT